MLEPVRRNSRPPSSQPSYLTSVQDSRAVLGCKTHWCRCRDAGLLSRNTARMAAQDTPGLVGTLHQL